MLLSNKTILHDQKKSFSIFFWKLAAFVSCRLSSKYLSIFERTFWPRIGCVSSAVWQTRTVRHICPRKFSFVCMCELCVVCACIYLRAACLCVRVCVCACVRVCVCRARTTRQTTHKSCCIVDALNSCTYVRQICLFVCLLLLLLLLLLLYFFCQKRTNRRAIFVRPRPHGHRSLVDQRCSDDTKFSLRIWAPSAAKRSGWMTSAFIVGFFFSKLYTNFFSAVLSSGVCRAPLFTMPLSVVIALPPTIISNIAPNFYPIFLHFHRNRPIRVWIPTAWQQHTRPHYVGAGRVAGLFVRLQ